MSEQKEGIRRRRICVRLTDGEHIALTRKAAESGYTESEFVRKAALGVVERKERVPLQTSSAHFYELAIVLRTLLEKLRHDDAFKRQEIVNHMDCELQEFQRLALTGVGTNV